MKNTSRTWLWIAAIMQYLTAAIHTIGPFIQDPPANETEAQLVKLMSTYRMELGGGFHPTMDNLFLSMSVSFTLLLIFGGVLNNYLLRKKPEIGLVRGIVGIQTIIFGIVFIIMVFFTFLIPIICIGLIFVALFISWVSFRRSTPH